MSRDPFPFRVFHLSFVVRCLLLVYLQPFGCMYIVHRLELVCVVMFVSVHCATYSSRSTLYALSHIPRLCTVLCVYVSQVNTSSTFVAFFFFYIIIIISHETTNPDTLLLHILPPTHLRQTFLMLETSVTLVCERRHHLVLLILCKLQELSTLHLLTSMIRWILRLTNHTLPVLLKQIGTHR